MTALRKTTQLEDPKINVRMKLSALWVTLMLLYAYADILSLYQPGQLQDMLDGRMGPFPATQGSLASAAVLMVIPALMIFLPLALRPDAARWTNILVGALYTAVNISNLIGETWMFYLLFGVVEIGITLLIIRKAWKWPKSDAA